MMPRGWARRYLQHSPSTTRWKLSTGSTAGATTASNPLRSGKDLGQPSCDQGLGSGCRRRRLKRSCASRSCQLAAGTCAEIGRQTRDGGGSSEATRVTKVSGKAAWRPTPARSKRSGPSSLSAAAVSSVAASWQRTQPGGTCYGATDCHARVQGEILRARAVLENRAAVGQAGAGSCSSEWASSAKDDDLRRAPARGRGARNAHASTMAVAALMFNDAGKAASRPPSAILSSPKTICPRDESVPRR